MPSKHIKEFIIVNTIPNSNNNQFTSTILYNNYPIGTMESKINEFPPSSNAFGAPYNTKYDYTLILNNENNINSKELNIALDSINTNGFYKNISGTLSNVSNIGMPNGIYKNIGVSPKGTKYNLTLHNGPIIKITLDRIC